MDALTSQALFTLLSLGQTAMRLSIVSHAQEMGNKDGSKPNPHVLRHIMEVQRFFEVPPLSKSQCKLSINEVVVNGEVYIAHFHLVGLLCLAGICAGYVDLLQAN